MNRVLGLALLATSIVAAESHLDIGIDLQRGGKLKEADLELRAAITDLTAAGNQRDLLKALSIEGWISVSLEIIRMRSSKQPKPRNCGVRFMTNGI